MNNMRKGIVVNTHPEDHSVDLVMLDDGSRLVGVQVSGYGASSRTGLSDLPDIPAKADKWDITTVTDNEVHGLVDYAGTVPVVMGFLFPQINQILCDEKGRRVYRHRSDVTEFMDGEGNYQRNWPNGLAVRIGEGDFEDLEGKNSDGNAVFDRNTDKQYDIKIRLAGDAGTIGIDHNGKLSIILGDIDVLCNSINIESEHTASLKAGAWIIEGNAHFKHQVQSDVDVLAGLISLKTHLTSGVFPGSGTSGTPVGSA
jgi:hypothetical protein